MPNDFNISENVSTIFEKLELFLKTKTVVGEPLTIGNTTIVPFIDICFGLGTGGGGGSDVKNGQGTGGGAGSGAKISPTAVLVIQGDKYELLSFKKTGGLERLIDLVPDIVDKVKEKKGEEEK